MPCTVQPFAADPSSAPPIGSPQWWKRPERFDLTGDSDTDTARIIQVMCAHIKGGANDAAIQHYAQQAAQQFAGIAQADGPGALAACAWWWCKTYIQFVHHETLLRKHLGESGHLQGLISPDALVRMPKPQGDCAIFTDCLCAFLRVFGVPYELVTLAVNPREPQEYSHVFCYAVLENGDRLPLDASHGQYPGWQVPSSDVFRRQVWDEDGNPVTDRGKRFDGLHGYGLRGWGMGQWVCPDPSNPDTCYDDGTPAPSLQPPAPSLLPNPIPGQGCTCINGTCLENGNSCASPISSSSPITVPAQNSVQWSNLIAALAKSGTSLAQLSMIQPGMVINPNGQIIAQAPGYAVPVGSSTGLPLSTAGAASISAFLPWLLGAGVLVMFIGMGKR